jgi:hypothetical protein
MARALRATDPKAAKPSRPKMLIFGKPGVGKTWTALDFPKVYYIDTEGGANLAHYTDKLKASGGNYLGPDQGSCDFAVVLEEIQTLATTKHGFKTLVIDSFSKLFENKVALTAEGLEKAGKKNEFGADRKPAVGLTRRMIAWCDKLDMNVILICHEKPLWKDGEQIGTTFAGYDKLEYELHLALNIIKNGASRKARVTKSRLVPFPDAEVFDWSYASFADRFGRETMEADAAPVAMATPEQIKQYTDLLSVVKVDAKVTDKWDENGEPSDLSGEDLQKRIDYLTKLLPKSA